MSSARDQAPVKQGDLLAGKYRVEKVLGAGGMGIVVAARHVDLNTRVALKFMLPEAMADREAVARFSREARAAVRLKSEHAARVFDVGKLKSGAPYMVMELLVGQDLGQLLEKGGTFLPIVEAVDYVLQASEAIAEAHGLGIIHRDLKPRNIFLTRRPDGRTLAKVLDFGLAKSVNAMSSGEKALTRTSAIMGSPQYMSPEQMRGTRDIDMRTDIWSLGICLYELLTHTLPFDAGTLPEVCALVLTAAPQPPQERRLDLPPALAEVILRCLEKDVNKRFANLAVLASALEPFADQASRGVGQRLQGVLDTSSTIETYDLNSVPPPGTDRTVSDTRTAASFDSKPERTRALTMAAVAATTFSVVIVAGGLLFLPRLLKTDAPEAVPRAATAMEAPVPPATPLLAPAASAPTVDPSAQISPAADPSAAKALPASPKKVTAPVQAAAKRPLTIDAGSPPPPKPATTAF